MEIEWTVEDGYVGRRPQSVKVSDEELLECDTINEAVAVVEEAIRSEFLANIAPSWDDDEIRSKVQKLFADKPKED